MNIPHNYRTDYPGRILGMSPWLCSCLPHIHGLNIYIPGPYLTGFHLTDVITSSITYEKAGILHTHDNQTPEAHARGCQENTDI